MSEFKKTPLNKVVRGPKRAIYSREDIYKIVDSHFICHLAYNFENTPIVIPTAYGRRGDVIYLHGATKNRTLNSLLENETVSVTITHMDGIVLARSVFHHSFNYRSAVIFGKPRLVTDFDERIEALKMITENIIPGRWNEAREPNDKEMKATAVIAVDITNASAKVRTGPPSDEPEDYELDIWAGVLPFKLVTEGPITDPGATHDLAISPSVQNYKWEN